MTGPRIALLFALSAPATTFAACGPGPSPMFAIRDTGELSRLMGLQADAERFLAGAGGEPGGSATGRLFAGAGELAGIVEHAGKQGAFAAEMWNGFASVITNSAEASAHLLPGEMQLTVTASPVRFTEDDPATGSWRVGATANSKHWNLTEEILTKALEMGMQEATLDPVLEKAGQALESKARSRASKRLLALAQEVAAETVGGDALATASAEQLGAFLDGMGVTEGPHGFHFASRCWQVDAGWDEWAYAEVDGTAIALSGENGYVPQAAGSATLRIWTVAGRQAFGNRMRSTSVSVEVLPIGVELMPSIQKVEAGASVPFIATIHNATDPGLAWTASAGQFVDRQSAGDGSETNVLVTPTDPKRFPIRVEVRSTSTSGARGRAGAPVRRATAVLQLSEPVIDIRHAGGCLQPGGKRKFTADVLGAERQGVQWTAAGAGASSINGAGVFSAARAGTYDVRATWKEDRSVSAEVRVRVMEDCDSWFSYEASGDLRLHGEGPFPGVIAVSVSPSGHCALTFPFHVGRMDHSLRLAARLPRGLREGRYDVAKSYTGNPGTPFGSLDYDFSPMWITASPQGEDLRPGKFHAALSADKRHGSDDRDAWFVSDGGTVTVESFDGKRVQLAFAIDLLQVEPEGPYEGELSPDQVRLLESGYPFYGTAAKAAGRQRVAESRAAFARNPARRTTRVTGHLSHVISGDLSPPDVYMCKPSPE